MAPAEVSEAARFRHRKAVLDGALAFVKAQSSAVGLPVRSFSAIRYILKLFVIIRSMQPIDIAVENRLLEELV